MYRIFQYKNSKKPKMKLLSSTADTYCLDEVVNND